MVFYNAVFLFISLFLFVTLPEHAFGDDSISWDFKKPGAAGKWRISGSKLLKSTKKGLKISGENFIQLLTPEGLSIQAEDYRLLEIRGKFSRIFGKIGVTWAQHGAKKEGNREVAMVLKNTGRVETVRVNLGHYPEWTGEIGQILFGFYSEEGEVEVESILIQRPTFLKKIQFAWAEFTHPEYFRPLSVNAIHGPDLLQKKWISWNYILIIFPVLCIAGYNLLRGRGNPIGNLSRGSIHLIFSLLLVLWVVFDIRFSYDMVQSLGNIRERAAASDEKKPFFILGDFFEFVEFCKKNLPPFSNVNYYAPTDIFFPRFKYSIYPHKALKGSRTGEHFVVHHAPDIFVSAGRLIRKAKGVENTISKNGFLMARYNNNSFIYSSSHETP